MSEREQWIMPAELRSGRHEDPEALHQWLSAAREYQGEFGQAIFEAHWEAHRVPREVRAAFSRSDTDEEARALLRAGNVFPEFDVNVANALGHISTGLQVELFRVLDWDRNEDAFYQSDAHAIMMRSNIRSEDMLITWAHELGHAFLHRNKNHGGHATRIAAGEIEAQTTAFLLLERLGVNAMPWTVLYLSGWTAFAGWVTWRRAASKAKAAVRMMESLLPVAPEDE